MNSFKKYRRTQIAEMRPITEIECDLKASYLRGYYNLSISPADIENGSPKKGDMIARNPKNHKDQWLVAEQYFKDNFEPI